MTFNFRVALITGCALFGAVAPILAHHSFAAEYDSTKTVTVKGTVSNLSWVNPHAYVYVDVKNASGKVTTWAFESLSPNALYRGDLFAAEHGSWNRTSPSGHELVRVPLQKAKSNGVYEDFMIFPGGDGTWGRPVGVATGSDGALYVTDDTGNTRGGSVRAAPRPSFDGLGDRGVRLPFHPRNPILDHGPVLSVCDKSW